MSVGWIIALFVVGYFTIGFIVGYIYIAIDLAWYPNRMKPEYEDFWFTLFLWPLGLVGLFFYSLWVVFAKVGRSGHFSFEKMVRATAKLFNVWGVKPR